MTTPVLTAGPYRLTARHMMRARIGDLLTVDVRMMLTTAAYTPAATDEWAATPAAAEISGPGYTAGGLALATAGRTVEDEDPGRTVLRCTPPLWPDAGFTCRYAAFYVNTGDLATSPLLSWVDFGATVDPQGEDFDTVFAGGVLRLGPPANLT